MDPKYHCVSLKMDEKSSKFGQDKNYAHVQTLDNFHNEKTWNFYYIMMETFSQDTQNLDDLIYNATTIWHHFYYHYEWKEQNWRTEQNELENCWLENDWDQDTYWPEVGRAPHAPQHFQSSSPNP